MRNSQAIHLFQSLSSGLRLDIFRLLVKRGTEGLVAGELAAALDVPPSNLSFHLKALTHAGLLSVEQEGRYQRYRANFDLMLELIRFLTEACCSGDLAGCAEIPALSMCPGNSDVQKSSE